MGLSDAIIRVGRLNCQDVNVTIEEIKTPYFDINPSRDGSKAAWFDTGLLATNSTRIEMCVAYPNNDSGWLSCGRRDRWTPSKAFQIHVWARNNELKCYIGWNSSWQNVSMPYPSDRGVFSLYQGKLYYNGDVVKTYAGTLLELDKTIWFCNINQNGSPADYGVYGRFYWGKIYENEMLTHHYIPQPDLTVKDIIGGGILSKNGESTIVYGEE